MLNSYSDNGATLTIEYFKYFKNATLTMEATLTMGATLTIEESVIFWPCPKGYSDN